VLQRFDLLHPLGYVVPFLNEFGKLVGCGDDVAGALLEQVEELLFLGDERESQRTTSIYIKTRMRGVVNTER
jgi:hypothetical protein